ncbi:hypothetical protein DM860_005829 [Cuscuta australis]|uniref:Uncharacterized protein n=2 Tax=Cuscuta sect. Cleistogrammica TaxID=1824901 RepID=A0A328DRU2_9ASTE|nr:hypothetical protein DM860_005829 [Cuscuta australis]
MRHPNEDASSSNLPFYYNNDDRALTNGQYHNYGFISRSMTDSNHSHEKDTVKQRMIEHEAVFKNQVLELHRLYVIQRGLMMEEAKIKEPKTHWLLPSKENHGYAKTAVSTTNIANSPSSSSKGNTIQFDGVCSLDYRLPKFPKKLPFNLELPSDNYIDLELEEHSSRHPIDNGLCNKATTQQSSVKKFFPDGREAADLNQPARLDCTNHTDFKSLIVSPFLASSSEGILKCHHGSSNGFSNNLSMGSHGKQRELLHCTYEAGSALYQGHIKSNLTQAADGLERNMLQMHSHGIRSDWWLEKKGGLQTFEKVRNNVFEKPIASSMFSTSSPQLANSSQCANSRSQSASPWGKLPSSLTHNASSSSHKNPRCDVPLGDAFTSDFSDNIKTSVGDCHSSRTNWYNKFLVSSNVIHSKHPRDLDLNKAAISEEDVETSAIDSSGEGKARNEKKKAVMIDINVACDLSPEQLVTEREGSDSEPSRKRKGFDLNSCVTEEDEDTLVPSVVASNDNNNDNDNVKTVLDIDWEAPFVLDSEEEDNPPTTMQTDDRGAAEAIVALSTETKCEIPPEDPLAETLRWFAGIVATSSAKERRGCPSYDSFEMMTLQLTETQEEEYMPKNPFYIPNPENMEGDGEESVGARTRRRGRQRRDFQREILPSLTSLSRHEVSQDFQTFGRLLSHCSSGWSRRSGTRKRRWDLEEEEEDEEERDKRLTGWGKTTRRRRRQRGPPVIPAPLTT